jgi:hypothetical protein
MLPSVQQVMLHVRERLAVLEEVSRPRAEDKRLRERTRHSSRHSAQPPLD